ncbi:enoyl-CoA-hydratase DpgB [Streptomyces sp. NPDC056500]|uniref:enoyl-CoA-hydratase DpgB n=1 Tax=Streptomyces sp. NPDC056500 TaxID=3345840 RepID=UPI003692BD6C
MSSGVSEGELKEQADGYLEINSDGPLSPQLIASVEELCDRAETASGTLVVVRLLPGAESADAAPSGPGDVPIHLVNKWERALRRLERLSAVTVAVAEGNCGGPAVEVLLSCDYRVGGKDLRLRLPFAAGEPWPGMLVHRLANQVGVAESRRLVLFGSEMTAERASGIGLVDEIADDVAVVVAGWITRVRGFAGTGHAIRRGLLLNAASTSYEEALDSHLAACDRALRGAGGIVDTVSVGALGDGEQPLP